MTRRMGTILAVFVVMVVAGAALRYARYAQPVEEIRGPTEDFAGDQYDPTKQAHTRLVEIGDPDIPYLADAVKDTSQPVEEIRGLIEDFAGDEYDRTKQAHRRLVEIGKPGIPYLADAVKDARKNVRWRAVQVLGAIGGDEVVPPLLLALADTDKDVRRYAVWFVGRWGQHDGSVRSAVKGLLYDPEPEVVWHTMRALEHLGDSSHKAEPALVEALSAHLEAPDDERREHAARALAMIGSGQASPALVKALGSPQSSWACRNAIVGAIWKIGSRNAVPLLLQLLTDETKEKQVRFMAALALQLLADATISEDLIILTNSPEAWLREATVRALGFQDNTEAVARLEEIVGDDEENLKVREEAAVSLGKIGDPRAVDSLGQALLTENDPFLRRQFAEVLGAMASPKAVPYLLEMLDDSEPYVVMHAAEALGTIGDKRAVEPLVRLFYREDAIQGPLASFSMFANIATVAHYALVRITGKLEHYLPDLGYITNQEQLGKTRALWRIKLQLNRKQ